MDLNRRPLEFELMPHRSLSKRAFVAMMTLVAGFAFTTGVVFMLAGAWPVLGFMGLDVLLIWLAFRLNYRAGQTRVWLRLTADGELVVLRGTHAARPARSWRFQSYWARADLEEDKRGGLCLYVGDSRQRVRIGAFMAEAELGELCRALNAALRAVPPAGVRSSP